nr:protein FAR1-RELATED SEQUENCE 5-like [Ipomoea trifida]
MKVNRKLDIGHQHFISNCAKANIGLTKSFNQYVEMMSEVENVGVTHQDFNNYKREILVYMKGGDAQMADGVARKHYTAFGDVVAFDATYQTKRRLTFLIAIVGVVLLHKGFLIAIVEDVRPFSFSGVHDSCPEISDQLLVEASISS